MHSSPTVSNTQLLRNYLGIGLRGGLARLLIPCGEMFDIPAFLGLGGTQVQYVTGRVPCIDDALSMVSDPIRTPLVAVFTHIVLPDNVPAALLAAALGTLPKQPLPPPRGAQLMLVPLRRRQNIIARLVLCARPSRNFIKTRPKGAADDLYCADGCRGERLLVIEIGEGPYVTSAAEVFEAAALT